jgi:hypothetical protein
MPLSEGTRLGAYQVIAPLGAGGMGEVYRVADTRLKRHAIPIARPITDMKDGVLMAVPFDPRMQAVTGAPVALIDGVMQAENFGSGGDETGAGQFAVSVSGTLAYAVGGITPPIDDAGRAELGRGTETSRPAEMSERRKFRGSP